MLWESHNPLAALPPIPLESRRFIAAFLDAGHDIFDLAEHLQQDVFELVQKLSDPVVQAWLAAITALETAARRERALRTLDAALLKTTDDSSLRRTASRLLRHFEQTRARRTQSKQSDRQGAACIAPLRAPICTIPTPAPVIPTFPIDGTESVPTGASCISVPSSQTPEESSVVSSRMPSWFSRIFGKETQRRPRQETPLVQPWWYSDFPDWAAPMKTPARFQRFMDAVENYFAKRKMPASLDPDGVVRQPGNRDSAWGLGNLLQSCSLCDVGEIPGLVANHFDTLARVDDQQKSFAAKAEDWEYVSSRLRVRLYDESEYPEQLIDKSVFRRDIPGLLTALAIDLPDCVQTVPKETSEKWQRSIDEVFEIAIKNTISETTCKPKPLDADGLQSIMALEGDSFFVASLMLGIDQIPDLAGTHGTIVSAPVRNILLALPLHSVEDLQKMTPLIMLTRGAFEDGPGSVSARLWWRHASKWHEIGYESDPERISLFPPQSLQDYLNSIT